MNVMLAVGGGATSGADLLATDLLANLAVILCVAAGTTVLFQRIRQPVILGYLLAGLIVGPHVPIPVLANDQVAHTLSELGVILLMFALGLEFSLRKLVKVAATAGFVAILQCSLMIWLGYLAGRLFGWTAYESLFAGSMIAISSTTIIVKAFSEQNVKGRVAEVVFGVLIVEDLIAVLLLAILTAVASGSGVSAAEVMRTSGRLAGFLLVLLVAGLFLVPRFVRMVVRLGRAETTVVACVGVCFAFALLARRLGYSVALGAFLGGALVAESGEGPKIEPLIAPLRDVFAAVFFVSVGMMIDPALVAEHWMAVLALTAVVIAGKLIGVTIGAFLAGHGIRTSVQAGMSLAQIGEFSFIIAGAGVALGVVRSFLYPVAVAVSALTTLVTPWLIRAAGPCAAYLDRRLPHAVQTWASLYGSWVQQLGSGQAGKTLGATLRRQVRLLLLDVALIGVIVTGASVTLRALVGVAVAYTGIGPSAARAAIILAAAALTVPFVVGALRLARALGTTVAIHALPAGAGLDLAAAPRRALIVTLQLAIVLAVGAPLLAIVQPFVPAVPTAAVLVLLIASLIVPFWRSAANLEAHVRAGAQVIAEALAAQARSGDGHGPDAESEIRRLVPGLGDVTAVPLVSGSAAEGRSLKDLNLRGRTGATVVALQRGAAPVVVPTGDEVLAAGDTLVVAGTDEAVAAAEQIFSEGAHAG
jgi:monovalent cation:H+ antiporter-2, CPA2 family